MLPCGPGRKGSWLRQETPCFRNRLRQPEPADQHPRRQPVQQARRRRPVEHHRRLLPRGVGSDGCGGERDQRARPVRLVQQEILVRLVQQESESQVRRDRPEQPENLLLVQLVKV